MEKLTAILVDDETHCLETLQWDLEQFCPEIEVLETCDSPEKGMKAIQKHQPDLVFLDIEMPGMNGFELLRKLAPVHFDVIFTTAYDQFALDAIKSNALDYLLKPIDGEELTTSVQKVLQQRSQPITQTLLEQLFENLKGQNPSFPSVALPTMEGLEFVEIQDIVYCESSSNYTYIYAMSGDRILVSKTLKEVESMLEGNHFFRVHNSYLVHLIYVKKYVKGKGGYLVLKNGSEIPVARSRKEDLLKLF